MRFRLLLACLFAGLLVGCGGSPEPANDNANDDSNPNDSNPSDSPDTPRPPDVPRVTEKRPLDDLSDDELIQCLGHEDRAKLQEAAERLKERGAKMIPKLIAALDNENVHVRAGAVYALSRFGPEAKSAIPRLQELREEDDREEVRDTAAFAIEAIQGN